MTSDTERQQRILNQVYDALGVDSPSAALRKLAAMVAADPVSPPHPSAAPVERCGCDESLQLRAELRAICAAAEQGAPSLSVLGCCTNKDCNDFTCMRLPQGNTCGDCIHADRCVSLFGAEVTSTDCGFFPRRFRERCQAAEDGDL